MNRKKNLGKAPYSPPETQRISLYTEQNMLIISNKGTGLTGAGIDETDADDNGGNIW